MKKALLITLALMLAISLTGCTVNILPAATLQGFVEFEGGIDAANVKVTLTPASAAGTSWVGYSDATGSWTTGRSIRPEAYTIMFEHADADESVTISFVVALPFKTYTVPTQTLPYTVPVLTGIAVSGSAIWDHDGNPATAMVPLLGAMITLDGPTLRTGYTDATGAWKINNVVQGEYDIHSEKDGWAGSSFMGFDITGTLPVVVPALVMIQDKVDVEGYVFEDDGVTPISGAAITLTPKFGAYSTLHTTTDALGFWEKDNIKAGMYSAKAEKTGFVAQTIDLDAMDSTVTTPIEAEDIWLPFEVVGFAGAFGTVVWDRDSNPSALVALEDVKVSFTPDGGELPIRIAFTNSAGEWSVSGLPLGGYKITFEKYGMATVELSFNASTINDYDIDEVMMIPGLTTEPIAVTGKVYDTAGLPIIGASAEFVPKFDWGYTRIAYTNEEGIFTIPSMIAGMYDLTVGKNGVYSLVIPVDLSVGGVEYDIGVFELELGI